MQRVRNKFSVSIAEVADNDAWQIATIGAACVSNDEHHCEAILREIVDFISESRLDAEVVNVETDVIDMDAVAAYAADLRGSLIACGNVYACVQHHSSPFVSRTGSGRCSMQSGAWQCLHAPASSRSTPSLAQM